MEKVPFHQMNQKKSGDVDLGTSPSQSKLSVKERKTLLKKQKAANDQEIKFLKLQHDQNEA